MPLNLPDKLPAIELLKEENIFVIDTSRATQQDIRPLRIVVLNLMPLKITTETDLVRLLSNTPLQVEISFMKIKSHTSKNTPIEHMKTFYTDFDQMRHQKYDGMIITGAPVEQMDFEEVTYWEEITEIFDWARTHVTSTLYICWAAQAGLYHHYGVPKYPLDQKMFGIFEHRVLEPFHSIFRGFDDCFYVPHSRHTEVRREDILKVPELTLLSESKDAGERWSTSMFCFWSTLSLRRCFCWAAGFCAASTRTGCASLRGRLWGRRLPLFYWLPNCHGRSRWCISWPPGRGSLRRRTRGRESGAFCGCWRGSGRSTLR